jgi:phosphohistidine swiveling domain-containing protein
VKKHYIHDLTDRSILATGGSKAKNLHFLMRHHFPVPPGWVVSWDALSDYLRQGDAFMKILRLELSEKIKPDQDYAVRSSASVEDDSQCSCAGLFRSFLKVRGLDHILDCIKTVWGSLESPEFIAYRQNNPAAAVPVKMAVIIQEMVPANYSGVVFSKNPLTGLSETIIEVGRGTGDDQTAARQDPERWVGKWGNWLQKPDTGFISEPLARLIVEQAGAIARQYGQPVDLEWAHDGQSLFFLQVRPITQLDIPVFSNRIAREMLPGIIKPLVWSVNTRLINQTWVDILARLTGDHSFAPESLTGHYYYRAYFNMALFGRVFEWLGMPYEALELLSGLEPDGPEKPHMRPGTRILTRLPRLIGFAVSLLMIEWQLDHLLRGKKERYQRLMNRMTPDLTSDAWLEMANQVFHETKPVAYYNIMIPMLAMMHHHLLASLLKKHGYDARSLELGDASAAEQYNPLCNLAELQKKYWSQASSITPGTKEQFDKDFERFLVKFGHFSDSGNDCSSVPWRETPEMILQMIAQPVQERQSAGMSLTFKELKLPWSRRFVINTVYRRTSRFAVHREAISSLYTFGYGQFRTCFVNLGTHLAGQGILEDKEDIFYLYWQELVDLLGSHHLSCQKDLVSRRRQDIENYRDAALPEMIFGLEQPPVRKACLTALHGIPTSLGTYTGPARILQGLADFERLKSGDVLVIPYSDVGWTPLFARAGAVVAESGGILSHSSIVAREYHIPAVVSVSGACSIADGTSVTVNGYTGDILVDQSCLSGCV